MSSDQIIGEHLKQDYGTFDEPLQVERILDKYALFPNEAIYIVDCQQAQMEPLTRNFGRITGIDVPHKNELLPLYEHVNTINEEAFLKYTNAVVKFAFSNYSNLEPEKDFVNCLYLTHQKKVILKSTSILAFDSKGVMRYSVGKLMDVTGLIPFDHFGYKFTGPNWKRLHESYIQQSHNYSVLSERETEILQLIGLGFSSTDIGEQLCISRLTVDKHRRNIISKLETKSTEEAYVKAKNMGLF